MPDKPHIVEKKLGRYRAHGRCHQEEGLIEIDPRLRGIVRLETLIHEIDHFLRPDKTEESVTDYAERMARLLWDQRVRIIEPDE